MEPHILVLTQWHPTPEAPEASPFLLEWTAAARLLGSVTVVHLDVDADHDAEPRSYRLGGQDVIRVGMRGQGVRDPLGHALDMFSVAAALRRLHADRPFDLIHAHAYPAGAPLAFWPSRPPVVLTEHFNRLVGGLGFPQRIAARLAYRAADVLTVVGEGLTAPVARLSGKEVAVVPNPLGGAIQPAPLPPRDGPLRIVAAGRLDPIKGFDVLIEAVHIARREGVDLRAVILGEGPQRSVLETSVRRLGLEHSVDLAGARPRERVWEEMVGAHAVVVSSRVETFSLVAAEALAHGRPVVVTRCGGPEHFVDDSSGVVVEPGDPEALASAVLGVLARLDGFDTGRISSRARSRFSVEAVAELLDPIYRGAMSATRGRRR